MPTETQRLFRRDKDGTIPIDISRNGRHQYSVNGGPLLPSTTGILGHLDSDGFGIGMNWTRKLIRESGDIDAAHKASNEARDLGTAFHASVESYVKTGFITEDPMFSRWLERCQKHTFFGTEKFVANEKLGYGYGGTIDALSLETDHRAGKDVVAVWDWKTKDPDSFNKYGPSKKDFAQVAAYAKALTSLDTVFGPAELGYIGYVMRDGSAIHVVEVDIELGWELFQLSHRIHTLMKGGAS